MYTVGLGSIEFEGFGGFRLSQPGQSEASEFECDLRATSLSSGDSVTTAARVQGFRASG